MPYIGQPLNAGNLSVQTGTGDGSDTTPIAALNYSVGSSESVAIYLDGVKQAVSTYTASGTVLTFTTAPPNLVGIEVVFLALSISLPTPGDGSVTAVKIAANAVDETKLKDALVADFTEVVVSAADSLLIGDATDSGNTKRDTVQGILDLVPASGGWEFVSKVTASSSATVAFTNMASGYDYEYVCTMLLPATDNTIFSAILGIAGPTYRTSLYDGFYQYTSSGGVFDTASETANIQFTNVGVGNVDGEEIKHTVLHLRNPAASGDVTMYGLSPLTYQKNTGAVLGMFQNSGEYTTAEAHTSIKFSFASGNIASGTIVQYRRANA